jgi:acyl carrier protein
MERNILVDKEQILTVLTALIKKTMLKKNIEIGPDDNLQAQAGLDSMGVMEIATKLEEDYNIQFDDSDIKEIKTLNATADLLLRKIAQS